MLSDLVLCCIFFLLAFRPSLNHAVSRGLLVQPATVSLTTLPPVRPTGVRQADGSYDNNAGSREIRMNVGGAVPAAAR